MERARILRFLRYAVIALGLTACVLLVALWVRSYWWWDLAYFNGIEIGSRTGSMQFYFWGVSAPKVWNLTSQVVPLDPPMERWRADIGAGGFMLFFPHWLPMLILGIIATLPWVRWSTRFSYVGACQGA